MDYNTKLDLRIKVSKTEEIWVPIKGWETLYAVSNFGRVKSLGRSVNTGHNPHSTRREHIMKCIKTPRINCRKVNFYDGKFCETCYVHRLVAEAFLDIPRDDRDVVVLHKKHSDYDMATNLVKATQLEVGNRFKPTKIQYRDVAGNSKVYPSIGTTAKMLNVVKSTINYRVKIIPGKMVNGYALQYAE